MGLPLFLVAAGLAVAGYVGLRKLKKAEDENRREMTGRMGAGEKKAADPQPAQKAKVVEILPPSPAAGKAPAKKPPPAAKGLPLEERILALVRESPDILQTELYGHFPGEERKALQETLLAMDKAGTLARTKEKSTYRLRAGKQ